MAEVYEAAALVAEGVEKPLVIKRILEEHSRDPQYRSMFAEEARIAIGMNHPNVIQVFDFGEVDERLFLAMELVRGKDLGALLARARAGNRPLSAGAAIWVACEVAKGLDYAHRFVSGTTRGVVHRDISPQNILLSADGAVKIGDFGIAKAASRGGTTVGATVRGKVRYMSPEQIEGGTVDGRSDLFSLGVVLYEMLTGTHAFDGASDYDVLAAVRRARPAPPSRIVKMPASLEAVVMRLLSKEPRDRFARGTDLHRELESVAAQEGIRATSIALAEAIAELFPDLVRVSDEHGETVIRRLDELPAAEADRVSGSGSAELLVGEKSLEHTRIRRMPDLETGHPVYVTEGDAGIDDESTASARLVDDATDAGTETTAKGARAAPHPPPIGSISSAARARARNDATVGRLPMPPLAPDESSTTAPGGETRIHRTDTAPSAPAEEKTPPPTATHEAVVPRARGARRPPAEPPATATTPTPPPTTPTTRARAGTDERDAYEPSALQDPDDDDVVEQTDRSRPAWSPPSPALREVTPLPGPRPAARRPAAARGSRVIPLAILGLAAIGATGYFAWKSGRLDTGAIAGGEEPLFVNHHPARFGYLVLKGTPGDRVTIDNVARGVLPLPPVTLGTGLHTVSVTGSSAVDFAVDIEDGKTEEKVLDGADAGDEP